MPKSASEHLEQQRVPQDLPAPAPTSIAQSLEFRENCHMLDPEADPWQMRINGATWLSGKRAHMLVTKATVGFLAASPADTMAVASAMALSREGLYEPDPVLTSSTSASGFSAIFLLIMLLHCSGIAPTVPETSRRA